MLRTISKPVTDQQKNVHLAAFSVNGLNGIQVWAVVALLFLGGILRFYNLGAKGLWGDEIWTAQWSQGTLAHIWTSLTSIPDMPLMYALVHVSTYFGSSEFWVRLPSALFGVAGLAIFYLLAKLTLGRLTALVALGLLAFSPIHIWYSQDARYYTQLGTLGTASIYFFYSFLTTKKSPLVSWFGFLLTTVAALYTHLFAGWIVLAQGMFAVYYLLSQGLHANAKSERARRDIRAKVFLLLAALLVLVVLTYPIILRLVETLQTGTSASGEGMATLRFPPARPSFLTVAFLGEIVLRFSGSRPLVFFMAPLFLIGLAAAWRRRRHVAVLALCLLTAPFLTVLFLDTTHNVAFKFFFYLLPTFLLLVAEGLVATARAVDRAVGVRQQRNAGAHTVLSPRRLTAGQGLLSTLFLCILLMSVRPIAQVYSQARINDWRSIAAFLKENVQPEDVVLTELWGSHALAYYLPSSSDIMVMDNSPERLQKMRNQAERVWLVRLASSSEQPMDASFQRIADSEWQDPGLVYDFSQRLDTPFPITEPAASIYLYQRTNATPLIDFTDTDDAQWTEVSYRHIEPGGQTSVNLTLAAAAPRMLAVQYFDHPGKDLQVSVDGEVIGSITGGSLGGWQRWQQQLPLDAEASVHVAIAAVGSDAVGLDRVELIYASAPVPLSGSELPTGILALDDQGTRSFNETPIAQKSAALWRLLVPGDQILVMLSIPDQAARLLTVTTYDAPRQSIEIRANGYPIGVVTGIQGEGGLAEEQVVVPGGMGEHVLIQLSALGPEASKVSSLTIVPID